MRAALIRPDGHVTWAAANSDGDNDSDNATLAAAAGQVLATTQHTAAC
ncbi:hypothetical protein WKI65_42555 [Streptomyces sp. MS1.AVA.3]